MTEEPKMQPAQTGNAQQQSKPLAPIQALRLTLDAMKAEFRKTLPPQIDAEKFVRTTFTTIQMNPDLLGTDRTSLLGSCMKAAQDGLLLDGREAALVIFKSKHGLPRAQYMPMIGGLLKKLRNSGELATISAHVVHENDEFHYELGDNEHIRHRPKIGQRGKATHAYAIAKTKDAAIYREVMTVDEIEEVRAVSRANDSGPWVNWWNEMARKTVLRRLMKRLPSSADVDQVLRNDDETNDLEQKVTITPLDANVEPTAKLRTLMGIDASPPAEEPQTAEREPGDDVGLTRHL